MGKWAARLAEAAPLLSALSVPTKALFESSSGKDDCKEYSAAPTLSGTDKTDERELVSVLAVTPERGAAENRPVLLARLAGDEASTGGEAARFLDRRARLLRWGWPGPEAEALAERLMRRDREADPRVSCADCQHFRPGRCGNHRRAGLQMPDAGRDLAGLLQRCPGFRLTDKVP